MAYTIFYKKTPTYAPCQIQCVGIKNVMKLADELTFLGYIVTRISRNV